MSNIDLKKAKEKIKSLGGLFVIGTERMESRRVDNQLRGRSGRQGDLGSTRFFLSLGDNLLRIFGGDRVAGLMNAFRVEEDMPIESGMLTRSLEGAQKKVETYYYDIRKQVFEYDEVMNNQRRAVYSERRRVLEGLALKKQVIGYGERTMQEIVYAYVNPDLPSEEWDLKQLVSKVQEFITSGGHMNFKKVIPQKDENDNVTRKGIKYMVFETSEYRRAFLAATTWAYENPDYEVRIIYYRQYMRAYDTATNWTETLDRNVLHWKNSISQIADVHFSSRSKRKTDRCYIYGAVPSLKSMHDLNKLVFLDENGKWSQK